MSHPIRRVDSRYLPLFAGLLCCLVLLNCLDLVETVLMPGIAFGPGGEIVEANPLMHAVLASGGGVVALIVVKTCGTLAAFGGFYTSALVAARRESRLLAAVSLLLLGGAVCWYVYVVIANVLR